jgi:hypothetical protein
MNSTVENIPSHTDTLSMNMERVAHSPFRGIGPGEVILGSAQVTNLFTRATLSSFTAPGVRDPQSLNPWLGHQAP